MLKGIVKRKRNFYSHEDDLLVLREVVGQNPFEDTSRWRQIRTNLMDLCGKDFSERSLKERVNLLAQRFSDKAQNDIYKSGIEEEISEIDDHLYTIIQLMNEFKSKTKRSTDSSHQKGSSSREALTNLMNESSVQIENVALSGELSPHIAGIIIKAEADEDLPIEDIYNDSLVELKYNVLNDVHSNSDTNNETEAIKRTPARDKGKGSNKLGEAPTRTRNGRFKQSSMRFLEKKNDRWFEIRSKELALEEKKIEIETAEKTKRLEMDERRLQMDEKRLAIEEKRLEMTEKRVKAELEIFQNQQRLMEMAFLNCSCKRKFES